MNYRCRAIAVSALLVGLFTTTVSAQWAGRRVMVHRFSSPPPVARQATSWSPGFRGYPSYEAYRYDMNERYPKFYGGFHSNQIYNVGIPTGDIGLRGNGIYPTPWSY